MGRLHVSLTPKSVDQACPTFFVLRATFTCRNLFRAPFTWQNLLRATDVFVT